MDWNLLLDEYKQWVLGTPDVYNINIGNPISDVIISDLNDVVSIVTDFFNKGATACHLIKATNKESLKGFIDWLVYVKKL